MKKNNINKIAFILLLILIIPITSAFQATNTNYEAKRTTQGLSGNTGTSNSFGMRFTGTANQPGNLYSFTTLYNLIVGWFGMLSPNNTPTQETPTLGAHHQTKGYTRDATLVSYWQFEHGSNKTATAIDSVGTNNGTLNGSVTFTDEGAIGSAYEFDGVDDFVNIGNAQSLNVSDNDFTVSAWFKAYNTAVRRTLIGSGAPKRFILRLDYSTNDGKLLFEIDDDTTLKQVISTSTYEDYSWHHAVGVRDGNNLRLYADGIEVPNSPTNIIGYGSLDSTYNLFIGDVTAGSAGFNGTIDQVMIFNRALSPDEIYEMYLDREINTSSEVTTEQDLGASAVNQTDEDDDNIKNIFNWYKNETSITVLNMPFEGGSISGTAAGVANGTKDYSGHCYDNATEILTDEGWKLFKDLNKNEKVATLNQETKELEWQLPIEYQKFDYDNHMYKITLEDNSNLLVSEKHKVYVKEKKLQPLFVNPVMMVEILKDDCAFFESENQDKASNTNSFKPTQVMPKVLEILNSSNIQAYNLLNLLSDSKCKWFILSSEFIENFFQTRKNIKWKTHFKPNSLSNFSKVIRERGSFFNFFNFSKYSSFTSNSSIGSQLSSSQNFWSSSESTPVLINSSNILFLFNSSLFTSDQFTQEKCFISDFSCLSNANVRLAIHTTPLFTNCSNFFNCSTLFLSPDLATSTQFTWGSLSSFAFNSSGIDNVILSILVPPTLDLNARKSKGFSLPQSDYVNTSNNVSIYKPFGLNKFELTPITEVYSDVSNGKEAYFLDSSNTPIKVKSIIKKPYTGKIYDVDVENDIVLVRRKNPQDKSGKLKKDTKGIWSGNSNNGTVYGAYWNSTGGIDGKGAYEFDGNEYINCGDRDSLDFVNTTGFTLSAWVKFLNVSGTANRVFILKTSGGIGYSLMYRPSVPFWRFDVDDGPNYYYTYDNSELPQVNEWDHVVGVYNANNKFIYIYVNGNYKRSTNASGLGNINNTGNFYLGYNNFNGSIDEVHIFNRSLSPEQVRALYNLEHNRIAANETNVNEIWKCCITPNDGTVDGTENCTNNITIVNGKPSIPVLIMPANNSVITNRTPEFLWNNSADPDGDTLTYDLLISDEIAFTAPIINITNLAEGTGNTSHVNDTELAVDTAFFWKARAYDGTQYSEWSNIFNFTLQSYLAVSLIVNSTDFGNMEPYDTNDTSDDNPNPLLMENIGNIGSNVTITGTQLFTLGGFPSEYYQYKIDVNETSSYDATESTTTYTNMTNVSSTIDAARLDWHNLNDTAELDINVTVPATEPKGPKQSTITITVSVS